MQNIVRILIVDDEPELRDFLGFAVSTLFPSEVMEASSGEAAIKLIENNNFDLILCDFRMPMGNGKTVFEKVKSLVPMPIFILITSDDETEHNNIVSHPGCAYLQKPLEIEALKSLLSKVLDIEPIDQKQKPYVEIPVHRMASFGSLPFDLYVKLGPSHFVKYLNGNRPLSEPEKERLNQLKSKEILVPVGDFYTYMAKMERSAFQSSVVPAEGLAHKFELATLKTEISRLGVRRMLDDKELIEMTEKNMRTVFAMTARVRAFKGLLDWVDNNEMSVKKIHSVLLTMFCNIILKNAKSLPYDFRTYLHLSYVAVLHDLNLDDYIIKNEHRILNSLKMNSPINKQEQELILEHVPKILPLITSWAHCPDEVISIIEQHHERPDGSGFPGHLTGKEIKVLSAIFNVAHDVAAIVWDRKNEEELKRSIASLIIEYNGHPHFEEPLKALTKYLLFN